MFSIESGLSGALLRLYPSLAKCQGPPLNKVLIQDFVLVQEKEQQELMAQREEKEMDYLEPFLEQLNVEDIKNVKLTCLLYTSPSPRD